MKIEVLVSTMNQENLSIVEKMNIQSDSIIINQTNKNDYCEDVFCGKNIKMYSFNERGVGLSRNNALMRSKADICLMADDDMVYVDEYEQKVIKAFQKQPNADMIMFNVPIHKKNGSIKVKVKKNGRIRFINALKYGTVNIAFKREAIMKKNILFSLLFGGGTRYSSGEDSIFITDALKNKLKIYSSTETIAEINEDGSTWFNGFNKKYLYDRGALYKKIGGNKALLLNLQFVLRHRKKYNNDFRMLEALGIMMNGSKDYFKNTF
ncbi:glycosyltransferase [Oceanobacillus sp. M65]|uniref:glycosyltransferase n=1 Tax=Oceanobacillus sp. M65 TaxID=3457435 RepID=UPI003FCE33F7